MGLSLSAPEASEGSLDVVSGCETGVSNPKLTRISQISPQMVCFPHSLDLIRAYIITTSPHLDTPFLGDLVVSSPGGSRKCRAASKAVSGGQGKPTAPERWPESSGRGLDDDFQVEAFFCHVWSFSVLLGRLQVAPGGIELRPMRS